MCKGSPTNLMGDGWCAVPRWALFRRNEYCFDVREVQAMVLAAARGENVYSENRLRHPLTRQPFTASFLAAVIRKLGTAGGALRVWPAQVWRYLEHFYPGDHQKTIRAAYDYTLQQQKHAAAAAAAAVPAKRRRPLYAKYALR
jgi:hypothetical protein